MTGPALRERYGVPDYLYHSGYVRTRQTAEGILQAFTSEERACIQVRKNHFLRERDPGFTYDMTKEEAERHSPICPDIGRHMANSCRSHPAARA
jgi:broad specificity phosphatase PhoE